MGKKTQYVVNVNNVQYAHETIQKWLKIYGFVYEEKDGQQYYRVGDGFFAAKRYFQYLFNGNQLIIYVFWKSHKKPRSIEDQFYGWAVVLAYQSQMNELFQLLQVRRPPAQTVEV